MDCKGIQDRLLAIGAPGLIGIDLPREPDPKDKKDKGRTGEPFLLVDAQSLPAFLTACRDDPELDFALLVDLTAADPAATAPELWVHVQLLSHTKRHRLAVRCAVPKATPSMPTSARVYRSAQWHEREAMEMFGIEFVGHPDPRHVLLPDDWVGHPLRKDYVYPEEYHGISCK
ncbi:MAG: NADH-quinone oxidoreductase subunit C [Planctomycetota bacterium]